GQRRRAIAMNDAVAFVPQLAGDDPLEWLFQAEQADGWPLLVHALPPLLSGNPLPVVSLNGIFALRVEYKRRACKARSRSRGDSIDLLKRLGERARRRAVERTLTRRCGTGSRRRGPRG